MAEDDPILLQILKEDPEIQDAEARYQQFLADDALRERYEGREKFLRDWRSRLKAGREEGRQEGLDVGRLEGALNTERRTLERQLDRRFGLSDDERELIQACSDSERLVAALDELADPRVTKEAVLGHLS